MACSSQGPRGGRQSRRPLVRGSGTGNLRSKRARASFSGASIRLTGDNEAVVLYGVLDVRIREVIELFASRSGAETFIAECLADEPDWCDFLAIELVEFETSTN